MNIVFEESFNRRRSVYEQQLATLAREMTRQESIARNPEDKSIMTSNIEK